MSGYQLRVKAEHTVRLVPHIPFLLAWLRHKDSHAAELFVSQSRAVSDDEVQAAYRYLLDALDTYGDLSVAQLRSLCMDFDLPVLARAVHNLFMGSEPRIVPEDVAAGLFKAIRRVNDLSNGDEVAAKLNAELDRLYLISREALGELCAHIRDTSASKRVTAQKIGPDVFLNEDNLQSEFVIASTLMQCMVEHADVIFGKAGTWCSNDPLGERRRDYLEDQYAQYQQQQQQYPAPEERREMHHELADAGFM